MKNLKDKAIAVVDAHRKRLIAMSMEIHEHPELCFQEFRASKLLVDYLKENGFKVEYPAYELGTAFKATIGSGKPQIAIIAEYDAVAEIGHACGHNIIATSAVGAGAALAVVAKELGGTVVVFGTPAEEGGNGKEIMVRHGAFADIDAAMMIHPFSGPDIVNCDTTCFILPKIEFFGKTAHPTRPYDGINAQDAMLITFTALNALRIATPLPAIDGTITKVGVEQHTIIPDHAVGEFHIRAATDTDLKNRLEKVLNCARAGALATGARLEVHCDWDWRYKGLHPNQVIGNLFDANMKAVHKGWDPIAPQPGQIGGGTDMGSVGAVVPAIHPWVSVAPADVPWHSLASAKATMTDEAHQTMIDCAKAMAMTIIDLISDTAALEKAKAEFAAVVK